LDPDACGPGLVISGGGLTVTNTAHKRWSAVRGARRLRSGAHSWLVRIDRCVSKNIFIGVAHADAALDAYVGSDRHGWGYLANRAIWHDKAKVRSYGDLFREGDVVGVHLDCTLRTLRYTVNGRDMGVAVQGLRGELYAAFSLYNFEDQLTVTP
ncbi:concanavalin A-like lectin/glucanase domain-containing protein, partial [Tribonema minus]